MIFFKLMIIFLLIYISFNLSSFLKLNKKKKALNAKKLKAFNKKNLNNWMKLTKKERYNLSKQESLSYMDKRKNLLNEIRKEYKKITRVDSDLNINDK